MSRFDRRKFLISTGALALPTLWIPRRARAATRAFGEVDHLLVLFARGGLRSHCLFNAVGTEQHNPFGVQTAAEGTSWTLGAACGADDIRTSFETVPSFAKVTNDVAVLACVDHNPGGTPDVDHRTATNRIATGSPNGENGLLSVIGRHKPGFENGFSRDRLPPVEIQPSELGSGVGDYAKTRPLSLVDASGSFASDFPVGKGWKQSARIVLDDAFRNRRSPAFRDRFAEFSRAKGYTREFADVLADPRLDVVGAPDAEADGFTNAQLIEVFGNYLLTQIGDFDALPSWGPDVAKALRFFALGVPACAVTRSYYDMHDREEAGFAPRTTDLVRQLAGLNYVLKRMNHAKGGTYWDRTLVVVVSEFSRNNTGVGGFNSGSGSDHVYEGPGPQRNQAIAVMGGVVTQKGKLLGATDEEMNAIDRVYSSRSLLATLLDVVGIDHTVAIDDEPIGELFS